MAEELKIVIDADVNKAIANIQKFGKSVEGLATGSIAQLQKAALLLRTQLANLTPAALKSDFGKELSSALATVNKQLKTLQQESGVAGKTAESAFGKAFSGAKQLANIIPGLGIGGLIGIAVSAIDQLTSGFFESAFGASKLEQAVNKASGSIDKDAASVVTMVRALQSGTLSSAEFKKVKKDLIDQAPEFQSSFDGDRIKIDASDKALTKYIAKLVTTVKVSAALALVNDTLAKSVATIAKGGDITFGEGLRSVLSNFGNLGGALGDVGKAGLKSIDEAKNALKTENIAKLIEDTFKKLGITFNDFAGTLDDGGKKIVKTLDQIKDETIARARLFVKEFSNAFVLPDLEETFFHGKDAVFKDAKKLLENIKTGNLIIKVPKVEFELQPDGITPLTKEQLDELTKAFFNDLQGVPVDIVFDPTLSVDQIKLRDQQAKLRELFKNTFGKIGQVAFGKINFDNLKQGIDDASKKFNDMKLIADTLTQSVGEGLSNAFNNVFDAILEGKNVFKALGESVKALVVETIKAIAKMLILKTVTRLLGGGVPIPIPGISGGGRANFGLGGAVGGRSFQNTFQVEGETIIRGNDLVTIIRRQNNTNGRGG